jgi:hypothetical protein
MGAVVVLRLFDWPASRIAPGANLIAFSFRPISAKAPDAPAREDEVDPDVHRK